jgi:hypothetical protein
VNDSDAAGIYEGVKLHKFNYCYELKNNAKFLLNKNNVMFNKYELAGFILSWYDSCAKRRAISNCVDIAQWVCDYISCYSRYYDKVDVYEGALGYYEALASADLSSIKTVSFGTTHYVENIDVLNPIPEVSWMLADYLANGKRSVWSNYLTEYIRDNIRGMKYKKAIFDRAEAGLIALHIPLSETMTIDDIDFTDEQAIYYFDNPFELDFHTNYIYISSLLSKVDK